MSFKFEAEAKVPPRDRESVRYDLLGMISPDFHPVIWSLIDELEDGAWRGGFDEGYGHGHYDGLQSNRISDE